MGSDKPKKKSDLSSASRVLQNVLASGKSPLSDQFLRWKIWRFWPEIVGATLGKVCEPVGYERGRLYIWVKSSARLQEIRFFEETLIKKVNEHVGRDWVKWIKFTLNRSGVPTEAQAGDQFKNYLAQDHEPESEA